jgi:hypothetical protein
MGSFSDAVNRDAQNRAHNATRCRAVKVADELAEDDRELYLTLLNKPVAEAGHLWLRNRVSDAGIEAPCISSIRRHRDGKCLCNDYHYPSSH